MVDFYCRHYRTYDAGTWGIDPEPFLGTFARRLCPGDHVLDVGCGSGRDLFWLQRKGMLVTGFERSPGLAEMARQRVGCAVIEGDFTHYDFAPLAVDALLLCGALVHIPHDRLSGVLAHILRALKTASPRRLVYLSVKAGNGSAVDKRGRRFYFWQQPELETLLAGLGMAILDSGRSPAADGSGQTWLGYVLHHAGIRQHPHAVGAHRPAMPRGTTKGDDQT